MDLDRRRRWHLTEYQHVEQSSAFHVFQWARDSERRRQLREATRLAPALAAAEGEWAQLLTLMHYVHGLSAHQGWQEAPDLSGLTLLAMAQDGRVTFRCVEFAHLLQQVCAAFGFAARVVGLRRVGSGDGIGRGHVVVDVWSPTHHKWVVLDPQFDRYYQDRSGGVLSAWELADRVRAGKFEDVVASGEAEARAEYMGHEAQDNTEYDKLQVPDGFDRYEVWRSLPARGGYDNFRRFWLEYYYQLVYRTRYALERPASLDGHSGDDAPPLFFHAPGELPPVLMQRLPQTVRFTTDRSKLDVPLEGVEVQWAPAKAALDAPMAATRLVDLILTHSMPWFDHYEVAVGGGPWHPHRTHRRRVALSAGENRIQVRAVNDLGRAGPSAVVGLTVN